MAFTTPPPPSPYQYDLTVVPMNSVQTVGTVIDVSQDVFVSIAPRTAWSPSEELVTPATTGDEAARPDRIQPRTVKR